MFFRVLATATNLDNSVFESISSRLQQVFLRKTLADMLRLTTLQMRNIIVDCKGEIEWIASIEEMLDAKFACPVEQSPLLLTTTARIENAPVCAVAKKKPAANSMRVSKFMSDDKDALLGKYLHEEGLLVALQLPEDIFAVVNTPSPRQQ